MFNIGPMELLVLAMVGLLVLGPDKLPGLAKDAARMLKTLRELATGARAQLRDELGPEFADVDLRSLNPRTAISRALLGEDAERLAGFNPSRAVQEAILGEPERAPAAEAAPLTVPVAAPPVRPLGRGEQAPFDADAT